MNRLNRHIPLAGPRNFRDFGGYATNDGRQVRRGFLFRSDCLSSLTDEDHAIIQALGIRSVCDLRLNTERERSPSRWYQSKQTDFYHFSLISDQASKRAGQIIQGIRSSNNKNIARDIMIKTYQNLVSTPHALAQLRQLFQLFTQATSLPVLIHCSGGKDRTGVSCALLLTLLGVDKEDIMADYMASLEFYTQQVSNRQNLSQQFFDLKNSEPINSETMQSIQAVETDYLEAAFDTILKNHQSFDGFFEDALGLDAERLAHTRQLLTE